MIYQDTNTPHCPPALFYTLVSSSSFWLQVFQSWAIFWGIQQFLSKILPGNWAKAMGHYYPDRFRRAASTCFQTFQASALYLPGASRLVHLTLANSYTFIATRFFSSPFHLFAVPCPEDFHRASQALINSTLLEHQLSLPRHLWFDLNYGFLSQRILPHPLQPSWAKPACWGTHHLQHPHSQSPLGPEAVEIFSELCTTTSRLCNNHFFLLRFLPSR